ncbi:CRISPR-associated protein Cas4 [Candidatus Vecturithrix granuli]|uniref:CRISPR-associated exonuclease Cas4 n=1 Tax=Vecturithrix granuli TaxID=1499967 RepID=A0A081CAM4_VECG1|nr:CRISPR-associated protein Cas4 [Candidatus Vecturithrix granuli]
MEKEPLQISMLNEFAYCPKSAWYLLTHKGLPETADTVAGMLRHERADSSVRTVAGDLIQTRTVYLYSDTYGLSGIADVVEEKQGQLYPVEYKKGEQGDWKNHQVQLCAQALCLEEMLRLRRQIRVGYLYYMASGARQKVHLSRSLRSATVHTIEGLRKLMDTTHSPKVSYSAKCPRCSWYRACLSKEVEILNKRQRWW